MDHEKVVNLKRQIIEKGVKQILEEAQVPMRYHLKVVKKLHKALQTNEKHAKDHEDEVKSIHEHYQGELKGLGDQVSGYAEKIDGMYADHEATINGYQEELGRHKELLKGEDGLPGLNAPPIDEEALVSKVLSKVPAPEKGDKGDTGDTLALDDIITAVVKRIQKGDVIHINNVKGAGGFIKDGIRYRFDELMHGSGKQSSSAISVITVSGTVNDSNLTFTAATQPTLLNINGAFYTKTGGAYTWSYFGTTITLNVAVGTGGQIYGI